jgi:hypothetical protein
MKAFGFYHKNDFVFYPVNPVHPVKKRFLFFCFLYGSGFAGLGLRFHRCLSVAQGDSGENLSSLFHISYRRITDGLQFRSRHRQQETQRHRSLIHQKRYNHKRTSARNVRQSPIRQNATAGTSASRNNPLAGKIYRLRNLGFLDLRQRKDVILFTIHGR